MLRGRTFEREGDVFGARCCFGRKMEHTLDLSGVLVGGSVATLSSPGKVLGHLWSTLDDDDDDDDDDGVDDADGDDEDDDEDWGGRHM